MPEAIYVASQKEEKICKIYLKLYVESAKEPQREENTYKELKLKGSRDNLIILEISAQNSISIFNQYFTICPAFGQTTQFLLANGTNLFGKTHRGQEKYHPWISENERLGFLKPSFTNHIFSEQYTLYNVHITKFIGPSIYSLYNIQYKNGYDIQGVSQKWLQ